MGTRTPNNEFLVDDSFLYLLILITQVNSNKDLQRHIQYFIIAPHTFW